MTAKKKEPATGAGRIPARSQGFYRDPETQERYRSVTTIINQGVPKEQLVFWAGNTVAECAMENLPYLVRSSLRKDTATEAFDWLKRAHTRKKDERAEIGSAVHTIIECKILGQPVPDEILNDPEMAPFLENFLAFVADFDVTFEASEMVVANTTEKYAGTLDYLIRSARIVDLLVALELLPADADRDTCLMGDTKTGGEMCLGDGLCIKARPYEFKKCLGRAHSIKGVYAEAGLQMSAYRGAEVAWLRDGTKVPMPSTHPVGVVLHLRPEGYLVVPALCDERVFDHFRYARRVADWTSETSKTVIAPPLVVPTTADLKASA